MDPEVLLQVMSLTRVYADRLALGGTLMEDEAMMYNQLCNVVKKNFEIFERHQDAWLLNNPLPQDEDDDDNGYSTPKPPPAA